MLSMLIILRQILLPLHRCRRASNIHNDICFPDNDVVSILITHQCYGGRLQLKHVKAICFKRVEHLMT